MPKGLNFLKKSIESLKKNEPRDLSLVAKHKQEIDKLIEEGHYSQAIEHEYISADQMIKMATQNPEKFLDIATHERLSLPEDVVNGFYRHSPDFVAKVFRYNPALFQNSKKVLDDAIQGKLPNVNPARALISIKVDPELVWQYLNSPQKEENESPDMFIEHYLNDNREIWDTRGSELLKKLEDPNSDFTKRVGNLDLRTLPFSQSTAQKMLEDADPEKGTDSRAHKRILRNALLGLEPILDPNDEMGPAKLPLRPEVALKLINISQGLNKDTQAQLAHSIPIDMIANNPGTYSENPGFSKFVAEDARTTPEQIFKIADALGSEPCLARESLNGFMQRHNIPDKAGFIQSAPPELQQTTLKASPQDFYEDPAFRQFAMQKLKEHRDQGGPFHMSIVAGNILHATEDANEIKALGRIIPEDSFWKQRVSQKLKDVGEYDDPEQVNISFGTGKMRQLRALAEEKGGQVSSADAKKAGFDVQGMGLNPLKDAKGNISAEKLTAHIESFPKYQYGVSHSSYGNEGDPDPNFEKNEDERMDEGMRLAEEQYHERFAQPMPDYEEEFDPYPIEQDYEQDPNLTKEENDKKLEAILENAKREYVEKRQDEWDENENERASDYASEHWECFAPDSGSSGDIYKAMADQQRHSHEPSKVLQVNLTSKQIKELKNAGVYDTFKDLHEKFSNANHPYSKGNGLGWVRYSEGPEGVHIDEVQSDLGQNFIKNLKSTLRYHEAAHGLTDEQRERTNGMIGELEAVPPHHYDTINKILFQGKHPSEVLHEAFLQHMRNTGRIGKNVHIWTSRPKSVLSGQKQEFDPDDFDTNSTDQAELAYNNDPQAHPAVAKYWKEALKLNPNYTKADLKQHIDRGVIPAPLPVHMLEGYDKIPQKMGYVPGKYGELSTQKTDHWGEGAESGDGEIRLKGQPTWKQKLVKSATGHKLGQTTTGKPVFDSASPEHHADFDALEHLEAAGLANKHMTKAFQKGQMNTARHFNDLYIHHMTEYSHKNVPAKKERPL